MLSGVKAQAVIVHDKHRVKSLQCNYFYHDGLGKLRAKFTSSFFFYHDYYYVYNII